MGFLGRTMESILGNLILGDQLPVACSLGGGGVGGAGIILGDLVLGDPEAQRGRHKSHEHIGEGTKATSLARCMHQTNWKGGAASLQQAHSMRRRPKAEVSLAYVLSLGLQPDTRHGGRSRNSHLA